MATLVISGRRHSSTQHPFNSCNTFNWILPHVLGSYTIYFAQNTNLFTRIHFCGRPEDSWSACAMWKMETEDVRGTSSFMFKLNMADTCGQSNGGFFWEDFCVLGSVLGISACIGGWYACSKRKNTADDFLTAGGTMSTLPTALSLATGFITAIELLGNPAEMYNHGSQFWMSCLCFVLVVPITSYLYLPVYMKLRLTSCYEYLELRFNKYIRYMASALYVFQMVLYTSVAVYAPALALSHVTGLNTYLAVTIVYLVCIFYASQGGMKAVIMTDTFQTVVLLLSIVGVMVIGDFMVGGSAKVFGDNLSSQRIELFNLDPDPTVRHSFWSVVIGGTFYWVTMFCSNQASIQKYLSVQTIGQVRRALWTSCFGLIIIFTFNFYTGMIMYSAYKNCDPLMSQSISAQDELLPYYVIEKQGHLKGIPGLFVAGIFAASLGTVASAINSLAAVSMKDLLSGLFKVKIPEKKEAVISKWLSAFFGLLSFGLVFIVEQLGSVLQVALSFNGITGGVTLGLFSLGMFFPWANSKGALVGALLGFGTVSWIGIGTQISMVDGYDSAVQMTTSISGCSCNNLTLIDIPLVKHVAEPSIIYKISYLWYSAIGFCITFVFGVAVSLLTKPDNPCCLHPDLISPPVHKLLGQLPNWFKEKVNLPLESKDAPQMTTAVKKKAECIKITNCDLSSGIVNVGLSMESEMSRSKI